MLVAVSLDGKISPPRSPGQTNPIGPDLIDGKIMELHNSQRASVDGIMVGLNCILLDNSKLTLREGAGKNPTRIVLDGMAEIPATARVLNNESVSIVVVSEDAPRENVEAFKAAGAEIIVSGKGKYVDLPTMLAELYDRFGIKTLLVEGGGTVHRSMIAQNLYDEIQLIICPFVMGGSSSITPVERQAFWPQETVPKYQLHHSKVIGDYLYVSYKPDKC